MNSCDAERSSIKGGELRAQAHTCCQRVPAAQAYLQTAAEALLKPCGCFHCQVLKQAAAYLEPLQVSPCCALVSSFNYVSRALLSAKLSMQHLQKHRPRTVLLAAGFLSAGQTRRSNCSAVQNGHLRCTQRHAIGLPAACLSSSSSGPSCRRHQLSGSHSRSCQLPLCRHCP